MISDGVRRSVDVIAAVCGLVVLSPLLAGAAIATRLSMGSPVVYRQRRLGLGGQPFELLKFRSMRHPSPGREGPEFDAERITRVGRWLRATSVDELPSLFNLLRGEITLVGPRPLPVHYWPRFVGDEYERFEVRPGITGLAQVNGRNTVDWPERLAFDVDYVRSRSLLGDARILFATMPCRARPLRRRPGARASPCTNSPPTAPPEPPAHPSHPVLVNSCATRAHTSSREPVEVRGVSGGAGRTPRGCDRSRVAGRIRQLHARGRRYPSRLAGRRRPRGVRPPR